MSRALRQVVVVLVSLALPAACGAHGGASSGDAGADAMVGVDAGEDGDAAAFPYASWFREVPSGLSGFDVTHMPDLNLPFSGGIGVAVGDIDGDGRPDLVAPSGLGPTSVFHNEGSWRFEDISSTSGVDGRNVANGATLCDVDGDGNLDLFLSTDEVRTDSNVFFFKGHGHGTFTDMTTAAGFAPLSAVTSVVCTDLDDDGLLDVYVSAYGFIGKSGFPGRQDSFYRNRGDGTFIDIAQRLGLDQDGLTWTVAAYDYDRDGDLDLYVGNDDFVEDDGMRPLPAPMDIVGTSSPGPTDGLYRNDGPGSDGYVVFTNVTSMAGSPLLAGRGTMGIVAQDVTGDGVPDYYLSNYGRKALLEGDGHGTFTDTTAALGLEAITQPGAGPASDPQNLVISWGSAREDVDSRRRPRPGPDERLAPRRAAAAVDVARSGPGRGAPRLRARVDGVAVHGGARARDRRSRRRRGSRSGADQLARADASVREHRLHARPCGRGLALGGPAFARKRTRGSRGRGHGRRHQPDCRRRGHHRLERPGGGPLRARLADVGQRRRPLAERLRDEDDLGAGQPDPHRRRAAARDGHASLGGGGRRVHGQRRRPPGEARRHAPGLRCHGHHRRHRGHVAGARGRRGRRFLHAYPRRAHRACALRDHGWASRVPRWRCCPGSSFAEGAYLRDRARLPKIATAASPARMNSTPVPLLSSGAVEHPE